MFELSTPPPYIVTEMSTVEVARMAYHRACDRYHAVCGATHVRHETLIAARHDWRQAKAILRAAEAWEAAA